MVMRYGEHSQDNRISTVYLAFGEVEPVRWTGERAELCGAAGLGVYGAATGTNRLGQYYCWNRTYDVNLGRWTMPDPVASPWWNLAFCSRPLQASDPTGLDEFVKSDADEVTE